MCVTCINIRSHFTHTLKPYFKQKNHSLVSTAFEWQHLQCNIYHFAYFLSAAYMVEPMGSIVAGKALTPHFMVALMLLAQWVSEELIPLSLRTCVSFSNLKYDSHEEGNIGKPTN